MQLKLRDIFSICIGLEVDYHDEALGLSEIVG